MRYSSGRFAGMFQVSKKTLRHYQRIGLLLPAFIDSDNGYAFYSEQECARMKQIIYLRRLGFSLDEIGRVLEGGEDTWQPSVKSRVISVRSEMRKLQRMERDLMRAMHYPMNEQEAGDPMAVSRFEVMVFTLAEPMYIIGQGARVPYGDAEGKMPCIEAVIDTFFGDDIPAMVPGRVSPHVRCGIVADIDPITGMGLYMMGDLVLARQTVPEGLHGFTVPEGSYARLVFSAADLEALVGPVLEAANSYLYGTWLQESRYEACSAMQIEVYREERFEVASNPEMELWIPIRTKGA